MPSNITDPATEIAEFIRFLHGLPPSIEPTWSILQKASKLTGTDYWAFLSVVSQRLVRLKQFISTLQDDDFDELKRRRISDIVGRIFGILTESQLNAPWKDTKDALVSLDDALQFSWFSTTARRYRPLRKLSDEERDQLISKIDEILEQMPRSVDVPEWGKQPLADGLQRMRLVIAKVQYFGHDAVIDQLLQVYHQISDLEDYLEQQGAASKAAQGPTILGILNVIALAVNLYCAPDMMDTAFEHYSRGWQLQEIKKNPRIARCETRLLAAPTHQSDDGGQEAIEAELAIIEPEEPSPTEKEPSSN